MRKSGRQWLLNTAFVVAGAAGILAAARGLSDAHGGDPRLVHVCVAKSGQMKLVDGNAECRKGEEPMDWPGVSMGPAEVLSQTSPPSSETKTVKIDCPAGKIAIGGGARLLGDLTNTALVANGPDGPAGAPTSWIGAAQEMGSGNAAAWQIRVDVTCAAMLPR